MAHFNPIRPITQRLNSTPVEDLPRYAGLLAASILSSAEFLRSSDNPKHDVSVQVHKLVTRVSSLLQDRSQEARFTGIVLVKALAEAVAPHELAKLGLSWVRSLLSCLNKSDPAQVKKLSIVAITRIFLLTYGDQAMVREITTPSLPAFMTACLSSIKPTTTSNNGAETQVLSPLLQPVLQCWVRLIRCFPSTIRPFATSIRAITLSLMSQSNAPQSVKSIAQQVFAALHYVAPKDTAATEWMQAVRLIIESAHQTSDLVLRSVIEEWSPSVPRQNLPLRGKRINNEVQTTAPDPIGMEKWIGLQAGCSRVVDLLHLLGVLMVSGHAQAVSLHLTELLDLCARLVALPRPSKTFALRENKEISQGEREELYANLVRIHLAVLELHGRLTEGFGRVLTPVSQQLLSQLWDIFESEPTDDRIRESVYETLTKLLEEGAVSLTAEDTDHIVTLIRACCRDLHTRSAEKLTASASGSILEAKNNSDSKLRSKHNVMSQASMSPLIEAAWKLLPIILKHVPSNLLVSSVRAELDRTAILVEHEAAMLSSVMHSSKARNDTKPTASILPFLARSAKDSVAFEALLRPRMPVLRGGDQFDVSHRADVEEDNDSDDAPLQDGADQSDTKLHAITDHVARQLEETAEADETSDKQVMKKRHYAAIEEAANLTPIESSKRVKPAPAPSDANEAHKAPDQVSPGIIDIETDKAKYATVEQGLSQANVLTQFAEEYQPEMHPAAMTATTVELSEGNKQDYDSDDSAIPQIDTAMSSDEDGDEDDDDD